MLPFLSKEVNYETKSGAFLCTCFADLLCGGFWLHLGKIYLVGVTPAASLFPNKLQLRQLVKRSSHTLLADSQLLGQFFARKDDKDLAVVVDPAVSAGELEAVEQEGVGHLGIQAHVRVTGT